MPAFEARPGMPYWMDLLTSEARKSSYFYSRIMGWEISEEDYRIARKQGMPVAGMVPQAVGEGGSAVPDAWVTYFLSTDIESDSAEVVQLGGRVLAEPTRVSLGTMALCADNAGGWFGLFQPEGEDSFVAAGEPGTPVWHEYTATGDAGAVVTFYGELFDWEIEKNDDYFIALHDGAAFAGIWDATGQIPAEVPSFWRSFIGVANIAQARSQVLELGGEVLRGPENSPFGVLLTAVDSTGAVVTFCEVDEPVDEEALDEGHSILHL